MVCNAGVVVFNVAPGANPTTSEFTTTYQRCSRQERFKEWKNNFNSNDRRIGQRVSFNS
jgi:hypothetical protein